MFAADSGGSRGDVPIVPMPHQYLVTRRCRAPARHADDARPRRSSSTSGSTAASSSAATSGIQRHRRSTGSGRFQRPAARGGLAALRAAAQNASARPGPRGEGGRAADQRPEAFTPDGEIILGPTKVRGFWVAAGFAPRARRRRRHGQARRRVDRRGSRASTSGTWTPAGSARLPTRDYASRARPRSTRRTTTSSTPGTSGKPRGLRLSPAYPRLGARSRLRREEGLGTPELVRPEAARRRRATAPRGWAGRHWSPAIGAEHRAAARRRALRRVVVRQDRGLRAGRRRAPRVALRQPRRARVGSITYTQMLNARAGSSATSRSPGSPRSVSGS